MHRERKPRRKTRTREELLAELEAALAEGLQQYVSTKALRALAGRLGLGQGLLSNKKKLAGRIARYWFDPATRPRLLERLDRDQALALAITFQLPVQTTEAQWVNMLKQAYGGTESRWKTAIEQLLLKGVVFPLEDRYTFGRGPRYFLPGPLCGYLIPSLSRCAALQKGPAPDGPTHVTTAPGMRPYQCAAFLCAVAQSGVRVNQSGGFNKSSLKRLRKFLPAKLPFPVEYSIQMLLAAGCLRADEAQGLTLVPDRISTLLQSERNLRSLRLLTIMATQHPIASVLLAVIYGCPPDGWATPDVIEVTRMWTNELLEDLALAPAMPIPSDPMSTFPWRIPLNQLLDLAATHSFFDILRDAGDRILGLRLSTDFLAIAEPPADQPAPPTGKLHVQPNLDIIAPPDVPGPVLARLIQFVDLKQMDVVVTYSLTPAACRRAAQGGSTAEDIIRFLQENSVYGVPDNVAQTVRGWMRNAGALRFVQGLVLQCLQPQAAAALKANAALRPYILQELSPQIFLVDGRAYAKLRVALEQAGYILPRHIDVHPLETVETARRSLGFHTTGHRKPPVIDFDELSNEMRYLLAEARAAWSDVGSSPIFFHPEDIEPFDDNEFFVDDYDDEDYDDDFEEDDLEEERVRKPAILRMVPPKPAAPPPGPSIATERTPSLGELTRLTDAALADALQRAIDFGLDAFISYPKEGRPDLRVYHVTPHWIETRTDDSRALWAYCHDLDREQCYLLAKIPGILLNEP